MTERVQRILDEVEELTFAEQTDLLMGLTARRHFSESVPAKSVSALSWAEFSSGVGGSRYRAGKKGQPIKDVAQLRMADWPEEDSVDEMIEYIYRQRREARTL